MQQVVIYSSGCQACTDAETIMRKQGAEPQVVDVQSNPSLRAEIVQFLEARGMDTSFPQIVIGERLLGNLDRLKQFEASGELNNMLSEKPRKQACCRGLPDDQCNDMHRGMSKEDADKAHAKEHAH